VPVVNIDNHPGNEHFVQINFVDITTPTVSEITLKIFESLHPELINEKISTSLLTALILKTKNFKAPNLSPQTLELASKLINYGADRELIMRHLYRSRSISALKLWGQALSRLQSQGEIGLVWTTLTREDFSRSGAAEDELKDVIDELIVNAPEAKIVVLLYEDGPSNQNPQEIHIIISVDRNFDAMELSRKYNPSGNKKMASFIIRKDTLQKAEEEIIEHLKKEIKTSHN
jgi:phosphoesterase RecJ-like protein